MEKSWFEIITYLVIASIIIGLFGWYLYFIWSDCLEENSILTCMRMLS